MWVTAHTEFTGNVITDQLANKGSEARYIGPEAFFGYKNTKYKTELKEGIDRRKRNHFENLSSSSLSRCFLSFS
jgi:hypothetical protein